MRTKINYILITAILLASCTPKQQQEPENAAPEPANVNAAVTLTQEQLKRAGVRFGQVENVELSHDVYAAGRLQLPNDEVAGVNAMINGNVSALFVKIGDPVAQGSPLCRLVHPDIIQIQEDYIKAKLDFELATQEYNRQKVLNNEKIASGKIFQESERNFLNAKAGFEALKMKLELAGFNMESIGKGEISKYLDIRSPIRGIVDKINVNIGNLADPGLELFHIVCKENMMVEIMVFEKDISVVEIGQRVTFELSNFSEDIFETKIASIGSTLHEDTRSIPVYALFEKVPVNVYPGMFLAATIHTGEGVFAALPESAVVNDQEEGTYVFYATEEVREGLPVSFNKARVKTGLAEDDYVGISFIDSLPAGLPVVIEGGYYLRAEILKNLE